MTKYTASIGTISHGTLRTEDLLSAFADELYRISRQDVVDMADTTKTDQATFDTWLAAQTARDELIEDARTIDPDSEDASEIVDELQEALEDFAPPYCYFGTHEGDGSDFGYWPCHDQIDELPRITDPCEHPVNLATEIAASAKCGDWAELRRLAERLADCEFIGEDCAFVNDHGNVTVYGADGNTIVDFV